MNVLRGLVLLCALVCFTSFKHQRLKEKGITTVVIDAGHGGHDSGCLGSHAKEKDVTLAVALRLGKFISDNFKDVKVIYTRKTDVFIPLDERAAVANNNKADLFISIHCNSGAKAAYGVETYVMGLHRTEENLEVSKRENSVVLLEKDYKTKYDGFDPDSPEGNIIFTLYQNAYLDQSLKISTMVQMETSDFAGRYNRGVKQAGFLVLYKTAMPSLLIETGFLTNPAEERYLLSKEGQEKLAYSFFRAFSKYKANTPAAIPGQLKEPDNNLTADTHATPTPQLPEKKTTPASTDTASQPVDQPKKFVVKSPAEKSPVAVAESTAVKPQRDTITKSKTAEKVSSPPVENTPSKSQGDTTAKIKPPAQKAPVAPAESTAVKSQKDTITKAKTTEKAVEAPAVKPQRDTIAKANPPAEKTATETAATKPHRDTVVKAAPPVEKTSPPVAEAVKAPAVDTVVKIKQPQPEKTLELHKPAGDAGEIYFTIQIGTSGKLLAETHPMFKGEKNIVSENVNGLFKYMTGKYAALNQAIARQNQLREAGFPDAFVVAYHNGTRITLKEAKMLLEKN